MPKFLAVILAVAFMSLFAQPSFAIPSDGEDAAIKHLIAFVRDSKLEFIRNGAASDSEAAAAHLELKYANGKKYISTADEFVDKLASKSSLTGKSYMIRQADGAERPVAEWLQAELKAYRESQEK